ncbi:MAG TPA: amidohydrolase family protein [Acidimicrobiales bacterium]|nr:amidohydrolase family protein [Acidimicrobiales bacterium]
MTLGYRMYDADNHLYETADAFTRHLPAHRRRDLFWVTDDGGHRHLVVGGRLWDYLPNPTFDPIGVAGCLTDVFAGGASMLEARNAGYTFEALADRPEYQHPAPRLARMDEQGVEAALLFPTLVSGLEEATADDVGLTTDLLWSFDRWLHDHWGFDRDDRLFAVPVLPLADVDEAVRLLDWLLDHGARAVMVRPAPVPTREGMRSPADPLFDPVWARCQEAGTLVCGHLSASGYHRYTGDWTGVYRMRPHVPEGPFAAIATHARPIMDFTTAMVVHGAVTRHPRLRLVSVENGADWVPWLEARFATEYSRYPGSFPEHPLDAFRRSVYVVPHWEEPVAELARHLPVERILAGSDFPHTDGLAEPADYAKSLDGLPPDDARRIMRDNLRSLLAAA